MKISQLVATKTKTPYYESVASRLPRKIKSQQHLLNLGYVITVQDLGLSRAKALDESFAVNLINSYHKQCLNEGVGSFLGKAAGNVAGAVGAAGRGIKNAWADAKKGYSDAKASWDPATGAAPAAPGTPPAGGTPPAAGGAEPATPPSTYATPAGGGDTGRPYVAQPGAGAAPEAPATGAAPEAPTASAPAGDIGSIMQAIDKLDKPTKQQLAGELEKSINAPEPAADKPAAGKPGAAPGTPPAAGGATPPAAPGAAPATEPQGSIYDPAKAAADKLAKNQADADQRNADIEKTKQANAAKAQQDAAIKAAADAARAKPGFQQSPEDKLAIKAAERAGIRESEEKKKKLKKKKIVAEFKSNFLGMMI
jgi:hypothetical protein